MNLNFDIKAWWHTLIDHLFSHPQAADFAHPAIAAAAAAMQPAPPPVVAPTPPAFPWAAYAGQTDRVAFMAFAMKTGGNPQDADKAAAYAAGVVKTETPVFDQGGGGANNSLEWDQFDGHHPIVDFEGPVAPNPTGKPVRCTVKLDAAAYSHAGSAPTGAFNIGLFETGGTVPCMMTAEVRDQNGNVVPCGPMGGGNGAMLTVPYETGQTYTVDFSAPVATRWGIQVFPAPKPDR